MSLQLLLNTDTVELSEPGWGKTISARQMEVDGPMDDHLWREPITGALMLRPGPLAAEWREASDFEDFKLDGSDFHLSAGFWETIPTKDGPADPFLSTVYPAGSSEDLIELDTGVGLTGMTTAYGGSLVWALQSKTNLAVNQGAYLELRNFGFDFEKVSNYLALMVGQYGLRLQTDGIAVLHRFDPGANAWTPLRAMRFAGQAEQHGANMSLLILPVLGNRLHFYFSTGRAVNAAFDHQRSPGPKDSYFSYRLPIEMEAWDSDLRVWRVTDEGPLRVAVAPGRRYFLQIGRVVYPQGAKTAVLAHEDIGAQRSNDPSLTPHLYLPGDSAATGRVLDGSTGLPFQTGTDTLPQAEVTLTATSDRVWSPELHAVTLDIPQELSDVEREPVDVSADVMRLRLRLHNDPEAQELRVDLRDRDYGWLREKPAIPCALSLAGGVRFVGELAASRAHEAPGPAVLRLRFLDGWQRLEQARLGSEISYDGLRHTDVVRRLLNRAGFPDADLDLSDEDLGLPGGGQTSDDPNDIPVSPAVNDWRFAPKPPDSAADALRLVAEEFSGWRLRHDAGTWRYGPKPSPGEAALGVYLSTADYRQSGKPEAGRVRAFDFTEHLLPPEFNVLYVYGADGTGGEVRRIQAVEYNTPSISDGASEDYVGRVLERHVPASWASRVESCSRVARLLMEGGGHARRVCVFSGEWKPGFEPDALVELFGAGASSLGVWRLDEVEIEVRRDREHLYLARYAATRLVSP